MHNPDYDHEAFLGREDAEAFDQLSPEESKRKLGLIYDKMDKDADGKVTEEELRNWIRHVQNRYIWSDTERQWNDHDPQDDKLSWQDYKKRTYGFMDEKEEESYNYVDMVRRDERRWNRADGDRDGHLTKEEFADFLHPEEAERMRDIVIDETLEDIDKDKDGKISLDEYIGDMWPNYDKGDEPDWVKNERDQFATFRDKNKDGVMDREEVQDWILPADYDHSEAEAKHLIFESDADRDGVLTREEVLEKYDTFVGSQATDFGEALERHDEF
ncbi:hypothetical protein CAPTEDRAFT_149313 [Capitella teleta]|uniref:Reticulocalbin-3 n=1 Tax=Capitella teleta TaxID=283909 RepID=R7UNB7_CAPTE|nr:hypothetical protein CAPTEDRAFT_149313 [Capitella teleta]|eukprot:ELU08024.1 hypothetical protein CAPTEDRAFT_149313 [Capitella teleta]